MFNPFLLLSDGMVMLSEERENGNYSGLSGVPLLAA